MTETVQRYAPPRRGAPGRSTAPSAAALAALLLAGAWWPAAQAPAGPPRPATAEEIAAMIVAAGESKDYDSADYVYVLDEADVYVQDSGLATTESCQLIKVLTDAGVRGQSVQRFDFDPATRRVTVRAIRVHHQGGAVENVPLEGLTTQPTGQGIIFWGGEQHLVGVPHLDVGDTLEIRVSRIGFNIAYLDAAESDAAPGGEETLQPPMPGHWYEVTLFQDRHPILYKRYSVHLPKDKPVQYEVYNGELKSSLWFDGDAHVYTFTARDVPAVKSEPHMVALDDCVPKLVMATVADWETKSRWFYDVNETQFEADDAIRAKVAEITAGLTTLDEKIAACNHWVADNIRYYGTSRGPCEGFTLHRGIETFRDRGGVCKDKAGMLVTMLRVLGVETYASLTMAGSRVEEIPADQFNHTVTVMREPDGAFRILDPTWIPLSREMWSSREALQGLVYGTPEGQPLTLSPYYPPEYNLLTCRGESRLDETGTLQTHVAMEMQGYPDTYLRRSIHRHRQPDVRSAFEEALNIAPNARLETLEYTDPYDYSRDGQVDLTVAAAHYAAGAANTRMFRLPLMSHPLATWLIPDLLDPTDAKERKYSYRLRATRGLRYEESIALPAGWKLGKLPEAVEIDAPAAALKFEAREDNGGLSYTFALDVKQHLVPPEDYPKLKEALEKMKEISDAWIVCTAAQKIASSAVATKAPSESEATHD